jgi:DNA ligase-1
MLFEKLVLASEAVRGTQSRLRKVEELASVIEQLFSPDGAEPPGQHLEDGVACLTGELPSGRIGLGPAQVFKHAPASAQSQAVLSIAEVGAALRAIGAVSGGGAVVRRIQLWLSLLERGTEREQEFLRRLVVGELRQGAQESVVVDAVARAARVSPRSLRRALMLSGSLPVVARSAFEGGEAALGGYRIQLLRPLMPMLAQSAETPAAALGQLGTACIEYKLDGFRIQAHKLGTDVCIFTRQLRDVTSAMPEIAAFVAGLDTTSLILDGEVLSLSESGVPEPFQVTMRRFGRKLDVAAMAQKQPLHPFFFDCLHRDGDDLIDQPTLGRLAELDVVVPEAARVRRIETADATAAEQFYEGALEAGHEGVMAKALDAPYAAGRRGQSWLKIKSHHSLDLVVLAVEWGSGRRQGWLSNLHLGARDPERGYVMIGKTFKGLTDELLRWQTEALLGREVAREGHVVHVRPELVVEIAFNDVQASPHYPGGVALRFARVKRYRSDKSPEQADTLEAVRALCPAIQG